MVRGGQKKLIVIASKIFLERRGKKKMIAISCSTNSNKKMTLDDQAPGANYDHPMFLGCNLKMKNRHEFSVCENYMKLHSEN